MNNLKERIRTKVEGIKEIYDCSSILIKEDINTGICMAYSTRGYKKLNEQETEMFHTNIEDESDVISYKILFLPEGRIKKINEQKDEFNLYEFRSLFHALFGEDISPYANISKNKINELVELYQSQKQFMKYIELGKVRHNEKVSYIGKYLENGVIKQKELYGNVFSDINLEDINKRLEFKTLLENSYLQDFESENNSLKFTISALRNVIDRDREEGRWTI